MSKAAKQVVPAMTDSQRELVLANLKLAPHFAKQIMGRPSVDHLFEDACAEAFVGLVEAALRFDPDRGTKFSTFAAYWIKMRVRRHLTDSRHMARPPRGNREVYIACRFHPTQRMLAQRLGRNPTSQEMMEALGCSQDQFDAARVRFRRYDAPVSHVDHEDGCHTPASDLDGPEVMFADAEGSHVTTAALCRALSLLTPQEREVIRRRYLHEDGETLREIGDGWGRTRERIRQIEAAALKKLKKILEPLRVELVGEGV